MTSIVILVLSYLVGSIPFGYLAGRAKGKNLFQVGSGNIGATNVGRVLGPVWGALVFVLDFLKGAAPVFLAQQYASQTLFELPHSLPVAAALAAFLGHLFPIFLGFRGGKGVATGAGAASVIMPIPILLGVLVWGLVVLCTRIVSLGSLIAAIVVIITRLTLTPEPFHWNNLAISLFCLVGSALVIAKHRANIVRLWNGSENKLGDGARRILLLKQLHVLSVGLWAGGISFFNLAAAPAIFRSFEDVVATSPSDRTAFIAIVPDDADGKTKKNLASALAGAAVGPIFPIFFAFQFVCGIIAFSTAMALPQHNLSSVWRKRVTGMGLATVMAGWPVSQTVSKLRALRWDPDFDISHAAVEGFRTWHLISLGLSMITIVFAVTALILAANLPNHNADQSGP